MTPAFGFSAGDLFAAIGLCTKIPKALRDSGGAASEYQQLILELGGLQDALSRLAALEPNESNINHVNAIRRMSLACMLPMQEFLTKLKKYEASLSPSEKSSPLRATARKTQYAVTTAEDVKSFRAMISGKVISINLLLATHASESLSRAEGRASTNHNVLVDKLEEAKDRIRSVHQTVDSTKAVTTAAAQQNTRNHRETTASLSVLTTRVASISTLGTPTLQILRARPAELRMLLQTLSRTSVQMYTILLDIQRKISAQPTLRLDSYI